MNKLGHPDHRQEIAYLTEKEAGHRFYTGLGCGFVMAIPVWGVLLWIAKLMVEQ